MRLEEFSPRYTYIYHGGHIRLPNWEELQKITWGSFKIHRFPVLTLYILNRIFTNAYFFLETLQLILCRLPDPSALFLSWGNWDHFNKITLHRIYLIKNDRVLFLYDSFHFDQQKTQGLTETTSRILCQYSQWCNSPYIMARWFRETFPFDKILRSPIFDIGRFSKK